MIYPIVIYPCPEGGFVAEIPALKGCLSQGETIAETLEELNIVSIASAILVRTLKLEHIPPTHARLESLSFFCGCDF
jgi:hypothetical protein